MHRLRFPVHRYFTMYFNLLLDWTYLRPLQGLWNAFLNLNMPMVLACFIDRHQVAIITEFVAQIIPLGCVAARVKMASLRNHSGCIWDYSCYHRYQYWVFVEREFVSFDCVWLKSCQVTIASPEDTMRYLQVSFPISGSSIHGPIQILEIDFPQIDNYSPSCFDITWFTVYGFLIVPAMLIGIALVVGVGSLKWDSWVSNL